MIAQRQMHCFGRDVFGASQAKQFAEQRFGCRRLRPLHSEHTAATTNFHPESRLDQA